MFTTCSWLAHGLLINYQSQLIYDFLIISCSFSLVDLTCFKLTCPDLTWPVLIRLDLPWNFAQNPDSNSWYIVIVPVKLELKLNTEIHYQHPSNLHPSVNHILLKSKVKNMKGSMPLYYKLRYLFTKYISLNITWH